MQKTYKFIAVTVETKELFGNYSAALKRTQSDCLAAMVQFFLLNNISPFESEQLASRLTLKIVGDSIKKMDDLGLQIRSFENEISKKINDQNAKLNQIDTKLDTNNVSMSQAEIDELIKRLKEAEGQVKYLQRKITDNSNYKEIIDRLMIETESFVRGDNYKEEHRLIWRHTQMQVSDFLSKFREIAGLEKKNYSPHRVW